MNEIAYPQAAGDAWTGRRPPARTLLAVLLAATCGMAPEAPADTLGTGACISEGGDAAPVGRQPSVNTTGGPVDGSGTFSLVAGCNASGNNGFGVTVHGARAAVDGQGGVAVGYGSAAGQWAVATGAESIASGVGAVATGAGSVSSGRNAVAIGGAGGADDTKLLPLEQATLASGEGAIAIGANAERGAQATGGNAIALGGESHAAGQQAVAIGQQSNASGSMAVAVGHLAQASGESSVALGDRSVAEGLNASALSSYATAQGWKATAVGHGSSAVGEHALAVGINNTAKADRAAVLGILSTASATSALALGDTAKASAASAIAMGTAAEAGGERSLALGAGASAEAADSVALGAGSQATRGAQEDYAGAFVGQSGSSGEVNLGGRQLTGVAAGSEDEDAANVAQLRASFQQSVAAAQRYTDAGVAQAKAHADKGVVEAKAHADKEVAGAIALAEQGLAVVGGEVEQLRRGADGVFRVSQDDARPARADGMRATAGGAGAEAAGDAALALGHGARASGAGSVALGADAIATRERTVSVGAPGHERTISHLADGVEASDAATVRQLDGVRDRAVQYDRAPDGSIDYTAVTLGRDAPVALGNLAPGSRADDAVNLAQLQASAAATLDSANAYADARVDPLRQDLWRLERRVDDIERRMDAGIAAAMGLKQAPAVSGRTTYYVGAGTWRGQQAGGLSLRRTADNGRWSLEGGVSGNREGVGGYLGVSGVLGR